PSIERAARRPHVATLRHPPRYLPAKRRPSAAWSSHRSVERSFAASAPTFGDCLSPPASRPDRAPPSTHPKPCGSAPRSTESPTAFSARYSSSRAHRSSHPSSPATPPPAPDHYQDCRKEAPQCDFPEPPSSARCDSAPAEAIKPTP